jgi:hypothetical protein
MKGACRNVALTCAYAVFNDHGDTTLCTDTETCLTSVSKMFYNSLLCDDGEVYDDLTGKCFALTNCEQSGGTVKFDNTKGYSCLCVYPNELDSDGKCTGEKVAVGSK